MDVRTPTAADDGNTGGRKRVLDVEEVQLRHECVTRFFRFYNAQPNVQPTSEQLSEFLNWNNLVKNNRQITCVFYKPGQLELHFKDWYKPVEFQD